MAQYLLSVKQFALTLPSHLRVEEKDLTPQEQEDFAKRHAAFYSKHQLPLSDPLAAVQLSRLEPGKKFDVRPGIKEIKDFLAQTEKDIGNRPWLQHFAGLFSGAPRSDVEENLKEKLAALEALEANAGTKGADDYNREYLKIMGRLSTDFLTRRLWELETAQDWYGAQQVGRNVIGTGTAAIIIIGSGGSLTPAVILTAGASSFGAYQATGFIQDISIAKMGGDRKTNPNPSLFALATYNLGRGEITADQVDRTIRSATGDALNAFTATAGAGIARQLSLHAMGRWLPQLFAQGGARGLSWAPAGSTADDLAQAAVMNRIMNAPADLAMRTVAGSFSLPVAQDIALSGQFSAQLLEISHRAESGEITHEEAQRQIGLAIKDYGANLAAAFITGPLSALAPNTFLRQLGWNAGTNAAYQLVYDSMFGEAPNANSLEAFLLNTIMAAAISAGHTSYNSPYAAARLTYMGRASIAALEQGAGRAVLGTPAGPASWRQRWAAGTAGATASTAAVAGARLGFGAVLDKVNAAFGAILNEVDFPLRAGLQRAMAAYNADTAAGFKALRAGEMADNAVDAFVPRVMNHVLAASWLNLSDEALARTFRAAEDFRDAYHAIATQDLTAEQKVAQRKALAVQVFGAPAQDGSPRQIGTIEQALGNTEPEKNNLNPETFSPYDPRARGGQVLRALVVSTFIGNNAIWASSGGFGPLPAGLADQLTLVAQHSFGISNLIGAAAWTGSLFNGLLGRNVEGGGLYRWTNTVAAAGLTLGAASWAEAHALNAWSHFAANEAFGMDLTRAVITAALAGALADITRSGAATALGNPPPPAAMKARLGRLTAALVGVLGAAAIVDWQRWARETRAQLDASGYKDEAFRALLDAGIDAFQEALPGQAAAPGAALSPMIYVPSADADCGPAIAQPAPAPPRHLPGQLAPPEPSATQPAPPQPSATQPAPPTLPPILPRTQFAVKPPHSAPLENVPIPLQSAPNGNSDRIDLLPVGSFVKATGEQWEADRRRWIQVTAGRNIGWVLAESLEKHPEGDQYLHGGRFYLKRRESGEFHWVAVRQGDNFWTILKSRGLQRHADEIADDNEHIPYVKRWVRRGDEIYIKNKFYYESRRGRN
jgi:hypothetical protein